MPTYTYRCESCGETFDKRQSFSDDALTTHEACGGGLRKVLHPVGIVFKGSGFYNTDYKNGSASKAKGEDGAASEGAATGDTPAPATAGASDAKGDTSSSSGTSGSTGAESTDSSAGTSGSSGATNSEPAKSSSTG